MVTLGARRYTLSEVVRLIAAKTLNDLEIEDTDALKMTQFYPTWESYIGNSLTAGFKIQYSNKLFETRQNIPIVLADQYPSTATAALYKEIDETHSGTFDDPIPYNGNMELFNGKYYVQYDIKYRCIRDTINPVYHDLADLVGLYVEVATEPNVQVEVEENGGDSGNETDTSTDGDSDGENGEDSTGSKDDGENAGGNENEPIPFTVGMALENGKIYSQDGVTYRCTRDSGAPIYHDLSALVGLYVEPMEG